MNLLFALLLVFQSAAPPEGFAAHVYRQTETRPLSLYVLPASANSHKTGAAVVFFFGGGWTSGSIRQFEDQARYLASRGYTAVLVDYRVKNRDGSTPFDSVADAQAAIGWVRAHAGEWKVSPHRIYAAGGSAGGHLAIETAIRPSPAGVDSRPDALILYNPVMDTSESGFGYKLLGERALEISPVHRLRRGMPPAIVFHGRDDRTVPFANAVEFEKRMKALGNRCELVPYDGADHGFFNSPSFRKGLSAQIYQDVLQRTERFMQSLPE